MADFRKMFYASAIVALACFTVPASAQSLNCLDLHATNEQIRIEGNAERVGDIVLGCSGTGFTTPAGSSVQAADITVSIPSAIITSKVINPGNSTPISEATLIIDDLKDQTNSSAYPGSRPHLICSDTSATVSGLGVCSIIAKSSGPQDTYDGTTGHPNIFVGQPNGTGAVIFRGVPLDPPGTNFTRYLRITNIRVNAAATGLSAGNPLSQISAIISFQGPAAVGLNSIQTTVATVLVGNGGTKVTADNTFLQCEYPTNTLNNPPDPAALIIESHGWSTSSGVISLNTSNLVHPVIAYTEGFQSAWKTRNMSQNLGTTGSVLGTTGVPVNGGGNNNDVSAVSYNAYSGSSTPFVNATNIAMNNPQIRHYAEDGFTETGCGSGGLGVVTATQTTSSGSFNFCQTATASSGAGVADAGTRLQSVMTNIPANAVVSIPTTVWLLNGSLVSGVAVLVSTLPNGQGPITPLATSSALSSLAGTVTGQAGKAASTGYYDLTGPTATFTYEIIMSDPFSTEKMNIYPIVYYPAGELTAKPTPIQPQANLITSVAPYTFAPWNDGTIGTPAQPTGNQTTNPLGQIAGTPRFVHTTGAASPLFTINRCTCSLLFPWVVSDNNYVTGIAVANTSADPTNTPAYAAPGFTAVQQNGTVSLYLFGTIKGVTAQTNTATVNSAIYPGTDTQALAGSYATFIVNTGFTGYAITQATFQYCHGLAFLFNATGAVPPVSYLGLVMDPGGLGRTAQLVGDTLGQ